MYVKPGDYNRIYKNCKICSELKHYTEFPKISGHAGKRKSYCKNCKSRRKEIILPSSNSGDICRIYKECKNCLEIKHYKMFPRKYGAKGHLGNRKNVCRDCKGIKYINFDTAVLSKSEKIIATGVYDKTENNLTFETYFNYEINYALAVKKVKCRMAVVINSTSIRWLYSKKQFKLKILERDSYTCQYCGEAGDTVDHIKPLSKGGRTDFDNCICACWKCNQSKADMQLDEYLMIAETDF